ncbi:hypothetical protein [Enterovibrio paralichthyis]|uniref:hypothetical protein n=1 Tax=Enterovibrio paralichthyis TaxID=2853805 RepID=UPI001C43F015|nr:hypothetical protein [Enterovibrio paralichthyis]MBV7298089.1 hypothetical protein [Enterovibrio paralichthyis]
MDSTIIGALIGGVATILAVFISWSLHKKVTTQESINTSSRRKETYAPDEHDIYFMQFILHDGYEENTPISTNELAIHHNEYSPLELEVKLINLDNKGFVKRVNREDCGLGQWQMTLQGVEFMLSNKHTLQDLVEERRKHT